MIRILQIKKIRDYKKNTAIYRVVYKNKQFNILCSPNVIKKIANFLNKYVLNISDNELFDFLDTCFAVGIVPVLVGNTGIGKTERVRQYCEKREYELFVQHLGQMSDVSEFAGISYPNTKKKTLDIIMNEIWEKIKDSKKPPVLFLDEYNRSPRDILSAVFQLLSEKRIRNEVFENLRIIGAINPSNNEAYMGVIEDDDAWKSRVCYIDIKADYEEWKKWYLSKKLNPTIIKYLNIGDHKNTYFEYRAKDTYSSGTNPKRWAKLGELSDEQLRNRENFLRSYLPTPINEDFIKFLNEGMTFTLKDLQDNLEKVYNDYVGTQETEDKFYTQVVKIFSNKDVLKANVDLLEQILNLFKREGRKELAVGLTNTFKEVLGDKDTANVIASIHLQQIGKQQTSQHSKKSPKYLATEYAKHHLENL
ncbi:MAG: AAA domain-containing protein [Bacteroidales bacterium]|nr:AAA domain-containing protein [Bacteroidales bacterium]